MEINTDKRESGSSRGILSFHSPCTQPPHISQRCLCVCLYWLAIRKAFIYLRDGAAGGGGGRCDGGLADRRGPFLCLAYKKEDGGKIDACGGACFLGYYDGLCETC